MNCRPAARPAARLLSLPILGYSRWLSPLLPRRCRFYPTCSAYALEAIRSRGAVVGLALTGWRLLRCQPFHPGGYEPVSPARRRKTRGQGAAGGNQGNRSAAPSVQCSTPHTGADR